MHGNSYCKPCQSRWLGMSQATGGNLQLLFCLNAHVQLPSKYIRLSSWISVARALVREASFWQWAAVNAEPQPVTVRRESEC